MKCDLMNTDANTETNGPIAREVASTSVQLFASYLRDLHNARKPRKRHLRHGANRDVESGTYPAGQLL